MSPARASHPRSIGVQLLVPGSSQRLEARQDHEVASPVEADGGLRVESDGRRAAVLGRDRQEAEALPSSSARAERTSRRESAQHFRPHGFRLHRPFLAMPHFARHAGICYCGRQPAPSATHGCAISPQSSVLCKQTRIIAPHPGLAAMDRPLSTPQCRDPTSTASRRCMNQKPVAIAAASTSSAVIPRQASAVDNDVSPDRSQGRGFIASLGIVGGRGTGAARMTVGLLPCTPHPDCRLLPHFRDISLRNSALRPSGIPAQLACVVLRNSG